MSRLVSWECACRACWVVGRASSVLIWSPSRLVVAGPAPRVAEKEWRIKLYRKELKFATSGEAISTELVQLASAEIWDVVESPVWRG